jgi:hypothetical protein
VGLLVAHAKLVAIEKIPGQWAEKSTYMSELIEINRNAIAAFKIWLTSK